MTQSPFNQPSELQPIGGRGPLLPCSRCEAWMYPAQACHGLLVPGLYCGSCWTEYAFPEEQRRLACLHGACP